MNNSLIYGVGINDAGYVVKKNENINGIIRQTWQCPYYSKWKNMLTRCYSESEHKRLPKYKGCSVCEEWLTFSNFKDWMETQDWKGKHLDKDLLKEGNKIYCPEYCIFVDAKINTFVVDSGASRGEYMIGVNWDSQRGKFLSRCSNPFTGETKNLGRYDSELEAHLAWKKRKHELACMLAESELVSDPRLAEALKTRYEQ